MQNCDGVISEEVQRSTPARARTRKRHTVSRVGLAIALIGGLVGVTVAVVLPSAAGASVPAVDTFSYTGSVQTYTVPSGVSSVYVAVAGAQGGSTSGSYQSAGGDGGTVSGLLSVSSGETINVLVGQQGGTASAGTAGGAGGYGGGGVGGLGSASGAGGGGGSFLYTGSSLSQGSVLVAGGGGGGGGFGVSDGCDGGAGGDPGGAGEGASCSGTAYGGGGATDTAGGAAGAGIVMTATAGTALQGGAGGGGDGYDAGAGGGGGYYGGGGGGGYIYGNGGGGGASWVSSAVSSPTYATGNQSGNGTVIIETITPPASASTTVSSSGVVTVSWAAPAGVTGFTGYYIYRNGTQIASVGPSTTSYTDFAAPAGADTYSVATYESSPQAMTSTQTSAGSITMPSNPGLNAYVASSGVAGYLLAGTGSESARYSTGSIGCGNSGGLISSDTFDQSGNLWVGCAGSAGINGAADGEPGFAEISQSSLESGSTAFAKAFTAGDSTSAIGAMAFDSSGDLWVADQANNKILEFTASQLASVTTTSGALTPSVVLSLNGATDSARAITFDQSGDLWVGFYASNEAYQIEEFTPGQLTTSSNPTPSAYINASTDVGLITSMAFDSAGNLWLGEYNYNSGEYVYGFSASQVASANTNHALTPAYSLAPAGALPGGSYLATTGLAFDSSGNLWVSAEIVNTTGGSTPIDLFEVSASEVSAHSGNGVNTITVPTNGTLAIYTPSLSAPVSASSSFSSTTGKVTVSWNPPSGTSGINGYDVFRNGSLLTQVGGATSTSYTDSTPPYGTDTYAVASYGSSPTSGQTSAGSVSVTVQPPASASATYSSSTNQVTVSWTASPSASATGITGYNIDLNSSSGNQTVVATGLSPSATSYTISTPPAGTDTYAVHATSTGGTSSGATATVSVPETGPTNVTATYNSSSQSVTVNWTDAPTTPSGYYVYVNGGSTPIATLGSSATSYTDSNPPAGNDTYSVQAYVATSGQQATPSVTSNSPMAGASVTVPINPPTGLVATYNSSSQSVALSWTDSTSNGVSGYYVYVNGGSTPIATLGSAATSYTDSNPPAGNDTYSVAAYDSSGTSSSATTSVTVTPLAPTGVTAAVGANNQSVVVSWTDSASTGVTGYNIYQGATLLDTTNATAISYTDSAPPVGSDTYSVQAVAGSVTSNGVSTTVIVPVSAPSGVSASYSSATNSVTVNWTAPTSTGFTGYYVYLNGGSTPVGTVAAGTTSYVDSNPPVGSDTYSVATYDSSNTSSATAASAVTVPVLPPTSPSALFSTSTGDVTVTWTASTSNGVSGYNVYVNGGSTPIATLGSSVTSYTDAAPPYGNDTYSVVAAAGSSVSTPATMTAVSVSVLPPSNVQAAYSSGTGKVTVTWTASPSASATGISGYNIYLNGGSTPVGTVGPTTTSWTDPPPSGSDTYSVAAYSGSGTSSTSSTATSANTITVPVQPPTGVSAAFSTSTGDVTVTWTDSTSSSVTNYNIYLNGGSTPVGTVSASATSFTDTAPPYGSDIYSVQATDGSNPSSSVSASAVSVTVLPPSNLSTAYNSSAGTVTINWTASPSASATGISGYYIYVNGGSTAVGAVGPSATSFTDNSPPGGADTYSVVAYYQTIQSSPATAGVSVPTGGSSGTSAGGGSGGGPVAAAGDKLQGLENLQLGAGVLAVAVQNPATLSGSVGATIQGLLPVAVWADTTGSGSGWHGSLATSSFTYTGQWAVQGAAPALAAGAAGSYTGTADGLMITVSVGTGGTTSSTPFTWFDNQGGSGSGSATNGTPAPVELGITIDFAAGTAYTPGSQYVVQVGAQSTTALGLEISVPGAGVTAGTGVLSPAPALQNSGSAVPAGGSGTLGTAVQFLSAATTDGMGTYSVSPGVSVATDTNSWAATYIAEVQYTIATGP